MAKFQDRKYPLSRRPETLPVEEATYSDIFKLINTFKSFFIDLDAELENYLTGAPEDGNIYGQQDGDWVQITGGGGGGGSIYTSLKSILKQSAGVYLIWDDVLETVTFTTVAPPRVEFAGSTSIVWSQSSLYTGQTAANTTNMRDGIGTTGTGTNSAPNEYIAADLGASPTITAVSCGGGLLAGYGEASAYLNTAVLEYATSSGGPWTSAGVTISGVTSSGADQFKVFALPVPVAARYWRLRKPSGYFATSEFRFYVT